MNVALQTLVDHQRIVAIDGAPVPAPPHAKLQGNHLFVNCHYDISFSTSPASNLLAAARGDALAILKRLVGSAEIAETVSVVVTIYGHFPFPGATRPARRRIYRVNLLCKDLPQIEARVTPDLLVLSHADESSELDEVAELIHQPTH
jgi:hypothetical protein